MRPRRAWRAATMAVVSPLLWAGGFGVAPAGASPAPYQLIDLGTLGGATSAAIAVSPDGTVAGNSATSSGDSVAFVWRHGHMSALGSLGGHGSVAAVINSLDDIAGTAVTAGGASHAFLWRQGHMIDLGTLGGTMQVTGINDRDQVVGTSTSSDGQTRGFIWTNNRLTDLGTLGGPCASASAIDPDGDVVGASSIARTIEGAPCGEQHGFIWRHGVMTDLNIASLPTDVPYGALSWSVTINKQGVVGGAVTQFGDSGSESAVATMFRWQRGQLLSSVVTENTLTATAMNDRGDVVGRRYLCCGHLGNHGVLWINTDVTYLTDDPPVTVQDVNNQRFAIGMNSSNAFVWHNGVMITLGPASVAAINDAGQIVGSSNGHAALWLPQLRWR